MKCRRIGIHNGAIRQKRKGRLLWAALSCCAAVSLILPPAAQADLDSPGQSVYESYAPEGDVLLHTELLSAIEDASDVAEAVSRQVHAMSPEQKSTPASVDQAVLFAETAVAETARIPVSGGVIHVSREAVAGFAEELEAAEAHAWAALTGGGVEPGRNLRETVIFETTESAFTIVLHADILDTPVERIRVERNSAPAFAITIEPADLRTELSPEGADPEEDRTLEIAVRETGEAFEPGTEVRIPEIALEVPEGQLSAPVTLSLNPGCVEPSSLTIASRNGEASASRYQSATRTLDARVDASDVYTFGRNNVKFSDLTEKNKKLRTAVEALARVNVVYGYSDNTFRPDQNVTRAEFVAFVMRSLGRVNNSLKSPFEDVREGNGCYHEIASAYYYGIINGYDPTHFRGDQPISKTQIYVILGRILQSEMGYWKPEHPEEYLAREYEDTIPAWAGGDIALATREGLVIRQDTGRFDGDRMMNRGDVALIIYGLYQKIA